MHDSTRQATPPMETTLLLQLVVSRPGVEMFTIVHPEADNVRGETEEMESTCIGG